MSFWTNNPLRNAGSFTTHNPTIEQGGGPTYYGILKRWAGSWVKAKLLIYTGVAWVTKKLYRWDDKEWLEIDTGG